MSQPRLVAWMCLAHIFSMTAFSLYPTLLPLLQREWGMSNTEAGVVGGAFFAGYMVAVPVLTSLTDRVDARRIYFVSSIASALAVGAFGLYARGAPSALLLQMIAGAGVAGTYMPGLKALADNTTSRTQSRAVSFYTAIFGAGIALSVAMAGFISEHWEWRTAALIAALGPPIAGLMVLFGLPRRPPPAQTHPVALLDFRPVLRLPQARRYVIGYTIHCWELFGSRSWIVAFLAFAQGSSTWAIAPVTIAAIANLCGPAGSIGGNEVAIRASRARVIRIGMGFSGVVTCALGFLWGATPGVLLALVIAHLLLMMSDSSAMTAGLVAAIDPRMRGQAMAAYSSIGFGAGILAPIAFGAVLDAAGGNTSSAAWAWAFASLGAAALVGACLIRFRD